MDKESVAASIWATGEYRKVEVDWGDENGLVKNELFFLDRDPPAFAECYVATATALFSSIERAPASFLRYGSWHQIASTRVGSARAVTYMKKITADQITDEFQDNPRSSLVEPYIGPVTRAAYAYAHVHALDTDARVEDDVDHLREWMHALYDYRESAISADSDDWRKLDPAIRTALAVSGGGPEYHQRTPKPALRLVQARA